MGHRGVNTVTWVGHGDRLGQITLWGWPFTNQLGDLGQIALESLVPCLENGDDDANPV